MEKYKGLQLKIIPNTNLEAISNEIVGFNIFNPSSYVNSGVGHGSTFTPVLKAGEEGQFVLNYELGVTDKDPQVPLMVPPAEKLTKLKDEAFKYIEMRRIKYRVWKKFLSFLIPILRLPFHNKSYCFSVISSKKRQ